VAAVVGHWLTQLGDVDRSVVLFKRSAAQAGC
jgi:hypothetical protein